MRRWCFNDISDARSSFAISTSRSLRLRRLAAPHGSGPGTDLPVVKPLTSMPGIVGGADQNIDRKEVGAIEFERMSDEELEAFLRESIDSLSLLHNGRSKH